MSDDVGTGLVVAASTMPPSGGRRRGWSRAAGTRRRAARRDRTRRPGGADLAEQGRPELRRGVGAGGDDRAAPGSEPGDGGGRERGEQQAGDAELDRRQQLESSSTSGGRRTRHRCRTATACGADLGDLQVDLVDRPARRRPVVGDQAVALGEQALDRRLGPGRGVLAGQGDVGDDDLVADEQGARLVGRGAVDPDVGARCRAGGDHLVERVEILAARQFVSAGGSAGPTLSAAVRSTR